MRTELRRAHSRGTRSGAESPRSAVLTAATSIGARACAGASDAPGDAERASLSRGVFAANDARGDPISSRIISLISSSTLRTSQLLGRTQCSPLQRSRLQQHAVYQPVCVTRASTLDHAERYSAVAARCMVSNATSDVPVIRHLKMARLAVAHVAFSEARRSDFVLPDARVSSAGRRRTPLHCEVPGRRPNLKFGRNSYSNIQL